MSHLRAPSGTVPGMDVQALAGLELTDSTRSPRRLGDLRAERPVVLVFLRHFG